MTRILAACVLAALALAGPAWGKAISGAKVCGADACKVATGGAVLQGFAEGGEPTDGPAQALPFYRVRIAIGEGRRVHERFTVTYVPKASLIRGAGGTWMPVGAAFRRAFLRSVPAGRPFPPAQLGTGAVVPEATQVVDGVYSFGDSDGLSPWALAVLVAAGPGLALMLRRRRG